jgi:hypothetical protein
MAIESTPGGGIIITGRADIHFTKLLTLASGIALEINTNGLRMSSRVSTLQACRNVGLVAENARPHKKKQLALVVAELRRLREDYTPNPTVQAAMDKVGVK